MINTDKLNCVEMHYIRTYYYYYYYCCCCCCYYYYQKILITWGCCCCYYYYYYYCCCCCCCYYYYYYYQKILITSESFIVFLVSVLSILLFFFFGQMIGIENLRNRNTVSHQTSHTCGPLPLVIQLIFFKPIQTTILDLEPNPCFQTLLIISKTYYRIFNCNISKHRTGQGLPFIFFELRAPTCL